MRGQVGLRILRPLLLFAFAVLCFHECLAIDHNAYGEDPLGDVCYGTWDVLGVNPRCSSRVERPHLDIIEAETWDDVSHVGFRIRVAGRISKSLRIIYGFRATIGESLFGASKYITIWVVDGTAYLMTDITRQIFPIKVPMATTIEGDTITVRISKTDVGECTKWEMKAFALEGKGELTPGLMIATAYYDDLVLSSQPISEVYFAVVFIILGFAGVVPRFVRARFLIKSGGRMNLLSMNAFQHRKWSSISSVTRLMEYPGQP